MPKPVRPKTHLSHHKAYYRNQSAEVICADCLDELPVLADLVFIDPPFNIGQKYLGYNDKKDDWEYSKDLWKWITTAWSRVSPTGVLCLHGPDALCETYLRVAKQNHFREIAWNNWYYGFGEYNKHGWTDSRCHLLVYAKGKTHTWNPDAIGVLSARAKMGDKRVSPPIVVNKHHEPFDVDITRNGKWGNPFKVGEHGTRKQVIEKYREWLPKQKQLIKDLKELRGQRLGCVCKPKECHGDVLVEFVTERLPPLKRVPGSVWGIEEIDGPNWGRIQGNNRERRPLHANQLPEKYLERILLAYTNPGDLVLDMFGGSGTTIVVAKALNRRCIIIEASPEYAESIRERLKLGAVNVGT